MKKILLICPFFGKLPKEYFQLILNSCKRNNIIDWLLITNDRTEYSYPDNVKVKYEDWKVFSSNVKCKLKKLINVDVFLERPYKLCDYKPIYGLIFSKYTKNYDYWGYTDLTDVIYGNLREFLTDNVLKYDKVNFLGHLTLYRNTKNVNSRVLLPLPSGKSIKEILATNKNMAFDESMKNGIQGIYNERNFSFIIVKNMVADISPMRYAFQLSCFDDRFHQYYEKYKNRIFCYDNGKLYSAFIYNGRVLFKEYGYIHFQKRKMNNFLDFDDCNKYLITPSGFVNMTEINSSLIRRNCRKKLYLPFFKLKWKAFKEKIKG
jgi:hypothetical protein